MKQLIHGLPQLTQKLVIKLHL